MDDGIEKAIDWRGSSLEDLLAFPIDARKAAGFELSKVQRGLEPGNWKPMANCGSGVIEIRLYAIGGAFRVVYVAKFSEAIYVLHCFQKKAEKTSRHDIQIIKARYDAVINERSKGHDQAD
ncbi:type II toxin-antitoxin system RelE/ParE family toxin [Serratia marcescens]|uniref:type II toxin-antitoxin system RelE/ParE family toxin n=1 Tax=Serratia marcescens TaxID=615 RepID=UPI0018673CD7|nr:type II toxin-antitoxin system RelE/ParE family toxin [Serratia marcescens]MBN5274055.1 type II toxin-antitoxin system RelE/ParE family toxin [Serratia marcescens]MBN5278430.1 type II toxin-antitoxin system RelE/ParE family toxin [Serratia marcescens]MBN5307144.1 type II toxin-antitoxin system RelE/ParE family toxin [Serratia marcescens]MBN5362846.1 type II toxin-antitoxin system RelE/ParE family toxin [Serratia marcescens]MBN5421184.1 type II toxin-antitoxin system RelE/ParE family toxin [